MSTVGRPTLCRERRRNGAEEGGRAGGAWEEVESARGGRRERGKEGGRGKERGEWRRVDRVSKKIKSEYLITIKSVGQRE